MKQQPSNKYEVKKTYSQSEEKEFVTAFLKEDRKAVEWFFKYYGGAIKKYAIQKLDMVSGAIDREDLFMACMAHILENDKNVIRQFKWKCQLSTYIINVSYRFALTILLKEQKIQKKSSFYEDMDILAAQIIDEFDAVSEENLIKLRKAMDMFKEADKLKLKIIFFSGKSTEEIMDVYGWKQMTVYSQKKKLIEKLKKLIRKIQ
jgi:RNA polymerase sigma factor (sigma-70 family)